MLIPNIWPQLYKNIVAIFRGMHGHLWNIAMRDYQESVTTGQTDGEMPDKVIPMCCYALQATQKLYNSFWSLA